jgi:hypothetical protein
VENQRAGLEHAAVRGDIRVQAGRSNGATRFGQAGNLVGFGECRRIDNEVSAQPAPRSFFRDTWRVIRLSD